MPSSFGSSTSPPASRAASTISPTVRPRISTRERVLVDEVPRARVRPLRDRLHEVRLRPGDRIGRELLAAVVEHERVAPVELRELDEAILGNRRPEAPASRGRRTRPSRRERRRRARRARRNPSPVLHGFARSRSSPPGCDVLAHELAVALEAAGREEELLRVLRHGARRAGSRPPRSHEHLRQLARVESHADRRGLPVSSHTTSAPSSAGNMPSSATTGPR